jgi:hypothetical protein
VAEENTRDQESNSFPDLWSIECPSLKFLWALTYCITSPLNKRVKRPPGRSECQSVVLRPTLVEPSRPWSAVARQGLIGLFPRTHRSSIHLTRSFNLESYLQEWWTFTIHIRLLGNTVRTLFRLDQGLYSAITGRSFQQRHS